MVRLAAGDRSAFDPLFAVLWPVLVSFTFRTLPRSSDAEDAAQQALLKVFLRIADFDTSRDGLAWVLTIAGFEALTIRKRRLRQREAKGVEELQRATEPGLDQEEQAMRKQLLELAVGMIGQLSDADREALADAFRSPEASRNQTLRKRRSRALERLRTLWQSIYGQHE